MKTVIYIAIIVSGAIFFNSCKSDQRGETENNRFKNDSANNVKINVDNNYLAPPDPDYSGDYFQKYDNGVLKVRGYFRFGKRHGKWMYFYPTGLLWSEAFFDKDKMDGESNVYHENGKLYYHGVYSQDKPIGTWNFYDTSGVLANTKKYDSIPAPK